MQTLMDILIGNRGDEDMMDRLGIQERNADGQMVVDFAKLAFRLHQV